MQSEHYLWIVLSVVIDWQLVIVMSVFGLAISYLVYRSLKKKKSHNGCDKCQE